MNIGWGRVDITPSIENLMLGGQFYARRATGIESPLYATTCLIEGTAIVSLDLLAVPPMIKEHIKKEEFNLDAIIFCATHTHSGPVFNLGNESYLTLIDGIHRSIELALENVKPNQKISFGYESAVTGRVRRVKMMKLDSNTKDIVRAYGATVKDTVMYYNIQNSPESFMGLEGDTNCIVNAMYTFDENDRLTGILANVPCPAQCLEHGTEVSADYWREVREKIAEHFDETVYVLPLCGASGECSPHKVLNKYAESRRAKLLYDENWAAQDNSKNQALATSEKHDVATAVFDSLVNIYDWARRDIQDVENYELRTIEVPVDTNTLTEANEQEYAEDIAGAARYLNKATTSEADKELARQNLARFNSLHERRKNTRAMLTDKVFLLQVGPCVFVFSGHELYSDFGHEIDVNSPFMQTFVVQNAGLLSSGYLAPQRHLDEGCYGSDWTNTINADGGKNLVKSIVDELRDMSRNDIERATIKLPEETVLANEEFRTFKDAADKHIIMQANGSYKIKCNCKDEHVETLYEPATDLVDRPYLEAGIYALYGCEAELTDAATNIITNVDAVDDSFAPVWTKFELSKPALVTRICIPMQVGSYNNVYVPVLKKLDTMQDSLPTVDCSGKSIKFIYEEN